MDTWTFIWLLVLLKIPIVGLLALIWWAVRQNPDESKTDDDGGIKHPPSPHRSPHGRPPHLFPRHPRRGPHGDPPVPAPARVRTVVARGRSLSR